LILADKGFPIERSKERPDMDRDRGGGRGTWKVAVREPEAQGRQATSAAAQEEARC